MILRRYTNAAGEQQEIVLSKEDWEKVTDESLDEMLGFKKPAKAKAAPEPVVEVAPEPVVEAAPEPVAEEAPAAEEAPVAEEAPTKKGK